MYNVEYRVLLYIRDIALVMMVSSLIFFSIRAKRYFNLGLQGYVLPLMGIFLALCFAYLGYEENKAFVSAKPALSIDLTKVEDRIDRHLFRHNTLKDQLDGSKEFAQAVYNETGKKIEVLVSKDSYKRFEPSQEHIDKYTQKQLHLAAIEKINLYTPVYIWLTVLLTSTVLAVLTPIKKPS